MRKALLALALLFLTGLFVQAELRTYQAVGCGISLAYDHEGNLIFLYARPGSGIFFGNSNFPEHDDPEFHAQTITEDACSPRLKQDPGGRLWMTWEQSHRGVISAHLARLDNGVISHKRHMNLNGGGISVSPDFDFDPAGNIWMTWIIRSDGLHQVLVEDTSRDLMWCVNPSQDLSVYTPRILVSPAGTVWIFWVSQARNSYRVCSSRFDGQVWSEVSVLNLNTQYPHLSPTITLDDLGHPWAVWSGYDGQDYEIWITSWDGNSWLPGTQITSNTNLSDLSPTIRFLPGNIPLVAWSQQGSTSRILARFQENDSWSPEICLVQDKGFNRNPQLAQKGGILGLSWENVHNHTQLIKVQEFTLSVFLSRDTETFYPEDRFPSIPDFMKKTSPRSSQLELKENQYIAFGDSITYGVLARTWFPDKGYVPRLETILKTWVDGARVLNRGVPGEQTWEGLARLDDVLLESGSKYILIMEGTNDMTGGIPSETAAFNLEEMVKKCLEFGVYPLVATIIPRSDSLWKQRVKEPTLALNQLIQQMIPSYFLPLADQYDVFTSHPEGYLALFSDGAHPNEAGYQLMAESWFDQIQHIPYPPLNLEAKRKLNQILFYDEHLNLLQWEENPLRTPDQHVSTLHVYRRLKSDNAADFERIAALPPEIFLFTDRDIDSDKTYLYFVQAENLDGVRGPVSRTVSDR